MSATTNNQTTDPWGGRRDYAGPYLNAFPVVPSNIAPPQMMPRAIYIGGAGNLSVIMRGDTQPVTFTGLAVGTVLAIAPRLILETGTTATEMVGLV